MSIDLAVVPVAAVSVAASIAAASVADEILPAVAVVLMAAAVTPGVSTAVLFVAGAGPEIQIPCIRGIGAVTAARLLNQHGVIEDFPEDILEEDQRALALLFKDLATLRTDAHLVRDARELLWGGPTPSFPDCAQQLGDARLVERCRKACEQPPA